MTRVPTSIATVILFLYFGQSIVAQTFPRRVDIDAAGCVVSSLACSLPVDGELTVGDCTLTNGTRYDVWEFQGRAGDLITVAVQPLDSTLTNPLITVVPPLGDASKTPAVGGAGTPTLRYVLGSSGPWRVAVGTFDLFASGRYRISLTCRPDPNPSEPQNCVDQALDCSQSFDWFLTATSCRFNNNGGAYAYFYTPRLTAGDQMRLVVHSDAFDPGVSIYRNGGSALASAWGKRITQDASLVFNVPISDEYDVAVYGADVSAAGEFYLVQTCSLQCTRPTITSQPQNQTVAFGSTATLSVQASGSSPLSYAWHDAIDPFTSVGNSAQLVTPPLTRKASYYVDVSNQCGTATSVTASVDVQGGRRRSAHH